MNLLAATSAALLCALPTAGASTPGLSMRARPVRALEGGPLVVDVTVEHRGDGQVELLGLAQQLSRATIDAPRGFTTRRGDRLAAMTGVEGRTVLGHRGTHTVRVYLHHGLAAIPSGRHRLRLTVSLKYPAHLGDKELRAKLRRAVKEALAEAEASGDSRKTAHLRKLLSGRMADGDQKPFPEQVPLPSRLTCEFEVNVLPATAERLLEIVSSGERLCASHLPASDDLYDLTATAIWTQHDELLPLCCRLLEVPHTNMHNSARRFLYVKSRESGEAHRLLIDYLARNGHRGDSIIFSYWKADRVELGQEDIDRLSQARNLWIRAQTCHTFPKSVTAGTRESTLQEARDLLRLMDESAACTTGTTPDSVTGGAASGASQ